MLDDGCESWRSRVRRIIGSMNSRASSGVCLNLLVYRNMHERYQGKVFLSLEKCQEE